MGMRTYLPNRKILEQVFREDFNIFMFQQFDWAMSGGFSDTIQKLALISKYDFVLTAYLTIIQ